MIVKDNALNLDFKLENTMSYKTLPEYNYWQGWWKEKARKPVEYVIQLLWQPLINVEDYQEGGFEYWSRKTQHGHGYLEWHQDTGEYMYHTGDNYWIADKSLIYYPYVSDDCLGGFLEIAPFSERGNLQFSQSQARVIDNNDIERIRPVTNRYVLIDSAQMHRISRVYHGYRINLATSIWKETPNFFKEHENYNNQATWDKINWEYKEYWDNEKTTDL